MEDRLVKSEKCAAKDVALAYCAVTVNEIESE